MRLNRCCVRNRRIFDMSDAFGLSLPGDAIKHLFCLFSQSVVRRWMSSDDTQCTDGGRGMQRRRVGHLGREFGREHDTPGRSRRAGR